MPLSEPPPRWSTGLLLSLTLCCGCQRSLPRVGQRPFDSAALPAASEPPSATVVGTGAHAAADGGWKSTATSQTFSTNGIPLTPDTAVVTTLATPVTTAAATTATSAADALAPPAAATATMAAVNPELTAPRAATLAQAGEIPPVPPIGTPAPGIRQTQYLAAATDRDMETLRQRLEQQTQVNAALTQAIVQLQRQTEAHHKSIVQLADELNARQARQDKVTEEILSLIDQMAGGAPPPIPAVSNGAAGTGNAGTGAAASGGGNK